MRRQQIRSRMFSTLLRLLSLSMLMPFILLPGHASGSFVYTVVPSAGIAWPSASQHCQNIHRSALADPSTPLRNGALGEALLNALGPNQAEAGYYWTSGYFDGGVSTMWNWTSFDGASFAKNVSFYDAGGGGGCLFSPSFCTWAGNEPQAAGGGGMRLALAARRRSVDGAMEWFSLPVNSTAAAGFVCKSLTVTLTFSDSVSRTNEKTGSAVTGSQSTSHTTSRSARRDGSSRTKQSPSASLTITRSESPRILSSSMSLSQLLTWSTSSSPSVSGSAQAKSASKTWTHRKRTVSKSILPPRLFLPVLPVLTAAYMGASSNATAAFTLELVGAAFTPAAGWSAAATNSDVSRSSSCLIVSKALNNYSTVSPQAADLVDWLAASTQLRVKSSYVATLVFQGNVALYSALPTGLSLIIGIAPLCTTRPDTNLFATVTIDRPPDVIEQPLHPSVQQLLVAMSLLTTHANPLSIMHLQQLNFAFDASLCIAPRDGRKNVARVSHFVLPFVSFEIGSSEVADYMAGLVVGLACVCALSSVHLVALIAYRLRESCSWREARSGVWFPAVSCAANLFFFQPMVLCAVVGLGAAEASLEPLCIVSLAVSCVLAFSSAAYACIVLPSRVEYDRSLSMWFMCLRWGPHAMRLVTLHKEQAEARPTTPIAPAQSLRQTQQRVDEPKKKRQLMVRFYCPPVAVRTPWMVSLAQQLDALLLAARVTGSGCWIDKRLAVPQSTCRQAYPLLAQFRRCACGPWTFLTLEILLAGILSVLDGLSILGYKDVCRAQKLLLIAAHGLLASTVVVFNVYRSWLNSLLVFLFHLGIMGAAAGEETGTAYVASLSTIVAAIAVSLKIVADCLVALTNAIILKGTLRTGMPMVDNVFTDDVAYRQLEHEMTSAKTAPGGLGKVRQPSEEDFVFVPPEQERRVVSLATLCEKNHLGSEAAEAAAGGGGDAGISSEDVTLATRLKRLDAIL